MSIPEPTRKQLLRAQTLIKAGRYQEARAVLSTINNPLARDWEEKMDALGYGVPDPFALPNDIGMVDNKIEKTAKNKYMRIWQSGGYLTRGCMVVAVVGALLVICGLFAALGQAVGVIPDTRATRTAQAENEQSVQQTQIAAANFTLSPSPTLPPSNTPMLTSIPVIAPTDMNIPTLTITPGVDVEATATTQAGATRIAQILATGTAVAASATARALLPTDTPFPASTKAPPTLSPTPSPIPTLDWRSVPTTTYFITSPMANVRGCASTSCQVVTQVAYRTPLAVVEFVSGELLSGDASWLHINLGTSDGYVHNSVVSLNEPPPATATPMPTEKPKYGTLRNPYASGSWLDFDDGRVRASRIVRPANSMVANFNMFNSTPATGSEYVLVWFEVYCAQQRCSPLGDLDIRLIDSNQQVWGEEWLEVLDPDLDLMEGLQGSTLAGWQLFEFPIGRSIVAIQVKWPKWGDSLYVYP